MAGVALLVALLCLAPGTAQAQTAGDALRFTQRAPAVSDARSLGMAGAGRAGIDDATALFYNPAGLGWMESSAASGALAIVAADDEARFQALPFDPDQPGFDATQQSESVTDYGGHFSLAYKVPTERGSFVLAGAYNQVNSFERQFSFAGLNDGSSITDTFLPFRDEYFFENDQFNFCAEVPLDEPLPASCSSGPFSALPVAAFKAGAIDYDGGIAEDGDYPFFQAVPALLPLFSENGEPTTIEQRGLVTQEGRLQEVSFGAGVAAVPNVMLGLSANVSFGQYRYENEYVEEDVNDEIGPDDYFLSTNPSLAGFDRLTFGERFTSDLVGVNLRGGLSADALPGVRLGLTVETPTFYQVDESFTEAEITTVFDQGDAEGNALSYGGRSGDVGVGENEYEVRTPWRLGAGAQVNLLALTNGVADLALSADVEFVDWTQLDLDSEFIDLSGESEIAERDFQSVLNTNLGAELRTGGASFRAGFAYRPDPVEGEFELEGGETTDASRQAFSLGAGYRFAERLRVDVGWMQERFDDQYRPYGSLDTVPGEDGGIVAPFVDSEVSRNHFLVGVTYSL